MDYSVGQTTQLNQQVYAEVTVSGEEIKPSLPDSYIKLNELDQHLLNDCYGRCNSIDKVSKETALETKEIYNHVDKAWGSFDMKERQQFLYYWGVKDE